ncbi:hypothetical protein [Plantactinospora endophytica]|uniref:Uncharacterized protein n=1 Tax=Plantactinospora endophytica TaxID=673535 RepID=A0ABQ4E8F2_9ACTN|nr:hypothetical protein [Plantactinospora endophytica]GIG90934.1 hypothetical protein Pen02_58700 [Plantactinospora endophytica]
MPTVDPPARNPFTPIDQEPADEPLAPFCADLSALLRTMPGLSTTPRERTDWFDRKADLLERVAAEDPGCDPDEVRELARTARVKADELRRGCS